MVHKIIKTENYLLVVDESDIKVYDYYLRYDTSVLRCINIESVFNEALNKNEVIISSHSTGDPYERSKDYLKKIIAHLPLNGSPILEGVALLPPIENVEYHWKSTLIIIDQNPTEFECEMESVRNPPPSRGFSVVPITVITAEGVQWVGKYL